MTTASYDGEPEPCTKYGDDSIPGQPDRPEPVPGCHWAWINGDWHLREGELTDGSPEDIAALGGAA